jgi:hypothetical protein
MLQKLEALAELSVARGCGFAALAIFTFMIGTVSDPALAFKSGGLMTLLACAVLLLKARNACTRPYKSTELWIMLAKDERPDAAIAQQVIGNVLRDVYLRFAQQAAVLAILMLSAAQILLLLGVEARPW